MVEGSDFGSRTSLRLSSFQCPVLYWMGISFQLGVTSTLRIPLQYSISRYALRRFVTMEKRKLHRRLKVETLEKRQLMAADLAFLQAEETLPQLRAVSVSFNSANGMLSIKGTPGNDDVKIRDEGLNSRVVVSDRVVATFRTDSIKSINANLGEGNDYFEMPGANGMNLKSVDVYMGSGAGEKAIIQAKSIGGIRIDARRSIGTTVRLSNTAVSRFFLPIWEMMEHATKSFLRIAKSKISTLRWAQETIT